MDCLLCNGLGIYLGMKTCKYLSIKTYHWRGLWNIPTYSGKIKRCAAQFTPYKWNSYDWKATTSLKRWITVWGVLGIFLMAELNYFYLKIIVWLPPPHYLLLVRVMLFVVIGAVSFDELYQYLTDKNCKRLGQQAWITIVLIATEFLICLKFGWDIMSKPLPPHISYCWKVSLALLTMWTVWKFWRTIISGFIPQDKREIEGHENGVASTHHRKKR